MSRVEVEDLLTDRFYEALCDGRGFEIDGQIDVGSWGEVYGVKDGRLSVLIGQLFPGISIEGIAVKIARQGTIFAYEGELAEDCLRAEVACGWRQIGVGGVPPALEVLWIKRQDDRAYFYRDKPEEGEAELAVVMPWFPPESNLTVVFHDAGLGEQDKLAIMTDVMVRIKAMQEPVDLELAHRYGSVEGVSGLVIDTRMKTRANDKSYPFRKEARIINARVTRVLKNVAPLIEQRLVEGKFGAQNGDPRPENVVVLRQDGRWLAPILDAVRLAMITADHPQGRLMQEWYMTDIVLQAGMALGSLLAKGYEDWFRAGVEAYETVIEPVRGDPGLERFFGIALTYGMSVEAHVLGYRWDVLQKKWAELVASNGWKFGDWPIIGVPEDVSEEDLVEYVTALSSLIDRKSRQYPGLLTIRDQIEKYWRAMEYLTRTHFVGWKERL